MQVRWSFCTHGLQIVMQVGSSSRCSYLRSVKLSPKSTNFGLDRDDFSTSVSGG